jgi:hypothetical protein
MKLPCARRAAVEILLCFLVLGALLGGPGALVASAAPPNPCLRAGNLLQNCGFVGLGGWTPFVLSGTPDLRSAADTCPGEGPGCGAPSLWLISDGMPFTAGVYQLVAVTPGVVYQADIGWAAVSADDFERKLGLDPSGGTDALAASVVWGRSEWTLDRWPDLTVSAQATGLTMTLFIWVGHTVSHGADSIYLDAAGLWPDPNQPAATATPEPTAIPTQRAAAAAQVRAPATGTFTSTPAPTPSPTAIPTSTPVPATATLTATPTPTQTPLPSMTPTRTPVPVAYARSGSVSLEGSARAPQSGSSTSAPRTLLFVAAGTGACAMLLAGLVAAYWLRIRRG